jgi:Ca2+-binding EF-hand superfamily protein
MLERHCILAVASRTDQADLEEFRLAFEDIDEDCDGNLSREEFVKALRYARQKALLPAGTESAAFLFNGMALRSDRAVSFTEFASACLHGRLAPLDKWLAEQAFDSLDTDRNGMLQARDVTSVFGELPVGLPRDRPFGLREWRTCLCGGSGRPKMSATAAALSLKLPKKQSFIEVILGGPGGCNCTQSSNDPAGAFTHTTEWESTDPMADTTVNVTAPAVRWDAFPADTTTARLNSSNLRWMEATMDTTGPSSDRRHYFKVSSDMSSASTRRDSLYSSHSRSNSDASESRGNGLSSPAYVPISAR